MTALAVLLAVLGAIGATHAYNNGTHAGYTSGLITKD